MTHLPKNEVAGTHPDWRMSRKQILASLAWEMAADDDDLIPLSALFLVKQGEVTPEDVEHAKRMLESSSPPPPAAAQAGETGTPRTDAEQLWALDGRENTTFVPADFARTLERELAEWVARGQSAEFELIETRDELAEAKSETESIRLIGNKTHDKLKVAEAELATLRGQTDAYAGGLLAIGDALGISGMSIQIPRFMHDEIVSLREQLAAAETARDEAKEREKDYQRVIEKQNQQALDLDNARIRAEIARDKSADEIGEEQGRWQEAIGGLLWKLSGKQVDGSSCDSGDPLDLTLTELRLSWPSDEIDALSARLDEARKALAECIGDLACYEGDPKFPAKNSTIQTARAALAALTPKP